MTRAAPVLLTCIIAAVILGAPTAAARPAGDRFTETDDRMMLDNGRVTVWFVEHQPLLSVFPSGNDASTGYDFAFLRIVEFRDLDGDDAPDEDEIVARLDFQRSGAFAVDRFQTDDETILNLTLEAPTQLAPREGAPVAFDGAPAEVSLVFQLRPHISTLWHDGVEMALPHSAVHWSLVVTHWPWLDADMHRLALETHVREDAKVHVEGPVMGATLGVMGQPAGVLTWTHVAEAWGADDAPRSASAEARFQTADDGTRVTFAYVATGYARLAHHGTLGIANAAGPAPSEPVAGIPGLQKVPAPAALAVAACFATAGALRRRSP